MGTCVALLSLPDQMRPTHPAAMQRDFVEAAAYADASQAIPSLLRALHHSVLPRLGNGVDLSVSRALCV